MTRGIADDEDELDPDEPEYDEQTAFGQWWAHLPDFIKPDYPLDIPPARLPFVREVFGRVGAPRLCAETVCRRSGACRGGDGPPCYRADRGHLAQVLFLWWMRLYADFSDADYAEALRRKRNPYAPPQEAAGAKPGKARRRRGQR